MKEECYRKMYAGLSAKVSEVIDLLREPGNAFYASCLLQKALWEAEELYLDAEDPKKKGTE